MSITKLFLDMDGVLADFDAGLIDLCGVECSQATQLSTAEFWAAVRQVPHFYAQLRPMSGAREFFAFVYKQLGARCEILTAIPRPERQIKDADTDKVAWVRQYLSPSVRVNTVYRSQKRDFCTDAGCVLLDDFPVNIQEWQAAGGRGILYQSAEQAIDQLRPLLEEKT